MNDKFKSLDDTLAGIREEYEAQLKAMGDALLAAQIEATMAKDQLKLAREAEASAQRVTTKLLTQFALVSKVFEEAREMALSLEWSSKTSTELPRNEYNEGRDFAAEVAEASHGNP